MDLRDTALRAIARRRAANAVVPGRGTRRQLRTARWPAAIAAGDTPVPRRRLRQPLDGYAPAGTRGRQRFREAGLVSLRERHTWFADQHDTALAAHGPTLNPWNPSRSPGSSGGAAALVAFGALPMAHKTTAAGRSVFPRRGAGSSD